VHLPADSEVRERIERLQIPFGKSGVDPYGISKEHLGLFMSMLKFLYRSYFSVECHGLDMVPKRGRGMIVGNHSGGIAIDGAMVIASLFLDMEPPRLAQGMVEKFISAMPFGSLMSDRVGHLTGLPEHAIRLMEDDRLLMVFPEGARGTAKLWKERYSLVDFGTGFLRLALRAQAPIIPTAVLGAGDAMPTIKNAYKLGRMMGVPYLPVTPYLLPLPLPVKIEIVYGEPMTFEGDGSEEDDVIEAWVGQVKSKIARLIAEGRRRRRG
jgi:1-acyl-sn-glycerol-3-phosphate acyltransferase